MKKIEDPAVVKAREMKKVQSVNQKRKLQEIIQTVSLPRGLRWASNDFVNLDQSSGYVSAWVGYLVCPVGTKDWTKAGQTPGGYYVKGVRFGWLTESASPGHIRERVEEAIKDFQKEIEAGTANTVKDGEIIPDDCKFKLAAEGEHHLRWCQPFVGSS